MRISRSILFSSAIALVLGGVVHAQRPTPTIPDGANFNFVRGVVRAFEPGEALSLVDARGDARKFAVSARTSIVDQAGEPVEATEVERGDDVTVTVIDPDQADAVSTVYRIVVANPLDDSLERRTLRGLVLAIREGENAVTLDPDGEDTSKLSFLYNEGDTEFVGGDGRDVREEELQAGDRILVHLLPQEDGGLMAERIVFLGDSAEPANRFGVFD